mgnify:CR=1 FL=1
MTWFVAIGLAAFCFAAMAFVLKVPKSAWVALGSALVLGLAGYATQASPGLSGAPKAAAEKVVGDPAALVESRRDLAGKEVPPADKWLVIGDALARNGQYADAAGVLLGAVENDPKNADGWLALANALTAHAEGTLSPASLYAFRQAMAAAPDHPGPQFFLGLALAQSGKLEEGRALWADLLARTPADAPWRADLAARLGQLDAFIAQQKSAGNLR